MRHSLAVLALATAALACGTPDSVGVDMSRMAVVGDSLSAGFENGSLLDTQQEHGFASQVAAQAKVPLALPLIAPPGIPNVLELVSVGPPLVIQQAPGQSKGRDDPTVQTSNFAVPGHTVHDALATRPDLPIDSLTDLVLGVPSLFTAAPVARSQVEWVEAIRPTVVLVWIGSNDLLGAVLETNPSLATPLSSFESDFNRLASRLDQTNAKLVIANLPDPTQIPFFTPAEAVAQAVGQPLTVIGPPLGLSAGDKVVPDALPQIQAILQGHAQGPLAANLVLTAAEAAQIRDTLGAYNNVIERVAKARGAAFVDVFSRFNTLTQQGVTATSGATLNTGFLGGIFSLDGIHPTDAGYSVVANTFIEAMNAKFATNIPSVPVVATAPPTSTTTTTTTTTTTSSALTSESRSLGALSGDICRDLRSVFAP